MAFWTNAVAKAPRDTLARVGLGLAHYRVGHGDIAEREWTLALGLGSDAETTAWIHNNLGALLADRAEYEPSDAHFEQAARLDPGNATVYYGLGCNALSRAQAALGGRDNIEAVDQLRKAEINLTRAIEINPSYVKAHVRLAHVLHFLQRDKAAMEHLDLVFRLVGEGDDYRNALETKRLIETR